MRLAAGIAIVAVFMPGAGRVGASAGLTPAEAAARADDLWKRRDDAAAVAQQKAVLEQAFAAAPGDYGLLWRLARWYAWKGDDPNLSKTERANLGKTGWDLAERAVAINDNHVAAQYWSMAGMGAYAQGLGIIRALTQGIEGKFRQRLSRAERFEPTYEYGAIAVAWGGYYAKLPWPKYDQDKAVAYFRRALTINPNNLRARLYWAELHTRENRPLEAKKLLREILGAPVNKYDPPEEKRVQGMAGLAMQRLNRSK
jgi:tetratricopeptide (TPR) repeat protein